MKRAARGSRSQLPLLCCAIALAALAQASAVRAQGRFDVEAFEPAVQQHGSIVSIYGTSTLEQARYSLALMMSYGRQPLSIDDSVNSTHLADLTGSIGTLQLMGAIGIVERFDLGLSIPVHRVAAGSDFALAPPADIDAAVVHTSTIALGDLRLVPRVTLIARDRATGPGLALLVPVGLPTGDDSVYAGESIRAEPRLAFDVATRAVTFALNAGFLLRREVRILGNPVGNMFRFGGGVALPLTSQLEALLETSAQLHVAADDFGSDDVAAEGLIGLRYGNSGWVGQLGAGPGYARGIAAPSYRIYAAIGFTSPVEPGDEDGDRLLDDVDRCPTTPEDADGFDDVDGCPDLDNDADGIVDSQDRCPGNAEDRDGFDDVDGCPDLDNDADGIADAQDRCPNQAEDRDSFEDSDGCPDPDNDGDKIADANDRCPNEAGVVEQQGCPALPPAVVPPARVVVTEKQIELKETVLFATNRAEIDPQSGSLLDEVASVLGQHPEITHVHVEGHTDDRGSASHNKKLSAQRASAVMQALVQRGIAADRLDAAGFGFERPLVPNDNPEGRATNRRVELHIER